MQITSKFIESNGATPDFHGQGRIQSRFSASEFDLRRWWSLESGKKFFDHCRDKKGWIISSNKGIKRKSENLTLGWPDILRSTSDHYQWKGLLFPKKCSASPCTEQRPYPCCCCENKGWWRMESNGVNLQKNCGQDQLVLLFAEWVLQKWGSCQQILRLPPCGLFLERKGMPDGMGTQINNSFSVCHNTGLLLTREMEEMWEVKHENRE